MKNRRELALMQIEKARKNINIAMKLMDYPESIADDYDLVDDRVFDEGYLEQYLGNKY